MGAHPLSDLPGLPIPEDVQPTKAWTQQMLEMAAHIGPYDTLRIVEHFGGQAIYVSMDPERNKFGEVVGPEQATILSRVYGRERLIVPTARKALAQARRGVVIAAARAKKLTISQAARILGTTRPYASELVNNTDEGAGIVPTLSFMPRSCRQIEMFGDEE